MWKNPPCVCFFLAPVGVTYRFIPGITELRSQRLGPELGPKYKLVDEGDKYIPFQPLVNKMKRQERYEEEEIAALVTECVHEIALVIESVNPQSIIEIEKEFSGQWRLENPASFQRLLRTRITKENRSILMSGVDEMAWLMDNYYKLGQINLGVRRDLQNGFFHGPRSAEGIVGALIRWAVGEQSGDQEKSLRTEMLQAFDSSRFERLDRLVCRNKKAKHVLASYTEICRCQNEDADLAGIVAKGLPFTGSQTCKEGLALVAAARAGMKVVGEAQLRRVGALISEKYGTTGRTTNRVLAPLITPRSLWDSILPYVRVREGVVERGTADLEDWLVTGSYSGVSAGLSREYSEVVDFLQGSVPHAAARERARWTIRKMHGLDTLVLEKHFIRVSEEVSHVYHTLRGHAKDGRQPLSRECGLIWLWLKEKLSLESKDFADVIYSQSMGLAAMSDLAASSRTCEIFCNSLMIRVLATMSCDQGTMEVGDGNILLRNDREGGVLFHYNRLSEETPPDLVIKLSGLMKKLCCERDIRFSTNVDISSLLSIETADFIKTSYSEAVIRGAWLNLVDIGLSPGDG